VAIIGIYKKIKESLLLSQNALAKVNRVISDATRQIKHRNGLLALILRDLGIDIPEDFQFETIQPLEYQKIPAYKGTVLLIPSPLHKYQSVRELVSFSIDTVAGVKIQEKDIISIVEARISITEVFNQRLKDFLETMNSESAALKEKISELEKSNKELQKKNEELFSKRKKLDSELVVIKSEIETISTGNHDVITQHNHLLEEYQTELGEQIALLEEIGKARLRIEQAKK
jgi:molecular chaperone DnaK (HSP70)